MHTGVLVFTLRHLSWPSTPPATNREPDIDEAKFGNMRCCSTFFHIRVSRSISVCRCLCMCVCRSVCMDQADFRLDAKQHYFCAGHVPLLNTHPDTRHRFRRSRGQTRTQPERRSMSCLPPAMTFLRERKMEECIGGNRVCLVGEASAHGDALKDALATGLFPVAGTSMGVGGSCRGEGKGKIAIWRNVRPP